MFEPEFPVAEPSYLGSLNEAQRKAVETTEGAVLVLAGAGTGKTRVLTTRLAHILIQGKAHPWQVMAVTFTNKAAAEMRERVGELVGRSVDGWWVGTFHALGARMLRRDAELVGLKSNFTILGDDDQVRLMRQILAEMRIDEKKTPPRLVLSVVQRWKDRGLPPAKVTDSEGADACNGIGMRAYAAYQRRLRELNAADFGDLLMLCLTLFQENPDVLDKYRQQFRYLLVDEYQDTNVAQYLWLRLLAGGGGNVCCVGDEDQSIYSWRGAEIGNILRFEKDFPGAAVVRLERNYRSTPNILGAASGLIANNESRLGKTLWTDDDPGDPVRVSGHWSGEDEARAVCDSIESLHRGGHALGQMAILVRTGAQTREFEERLIALGIPYRIVGGLRFYERQEIRDAIAYLRVVAQPDDDLAFERIVNVPRRGIGKATMQTLHRAARAANRSLTAAARMLSGTDELPPKARRTLGDLLGDFDRWRGLAEQIPHPQLANTVLHESGYVDLWKTDTSPDAPGRLENLDEMVDAMGEFESLGDFLEHVSLVMENDDTTGADTVNLMTLHGAKGLEFETVFLPGWEEGLFPHQRALDETGANGLEEERRLAYVGLTRARKRAVISFATSRRVYGQWQNAAPSRFIAELPPEHVVAQAVGGFGENGYGGGGNANPRRGFADSAPAPWRRRTPAPAPSATAKPRPKKGTAFAVGDRVFHDKFGYGRILAASGTHLTVHFQSTDTVKKVIADFVKPA